MRAVRTRGAALPVAAAIALVASMHAVARPLSQPVLEEIRSLAAQYIEDDLSPGLILGIRCGTSYWIEAFGISDISTGEPLATSHQFLVGSIAKQFVASAVMRLAEDGRLDLDDPICEYVPHLTETWARITVRHCLNHTSGTFSFSGLPIDIGHGTLTSEAVIGFITSGRLFFKPGEDFLYSTVGYFLLGYIVEQVTGASVDIFIDREFLQPLGMKDTGFLALRRPTDLAGYHQHYWRGQAFFTDPPTTSRGLADGMYSTARDLFVWQAALASGQVVSASSYATMTDRTTTRDADGEETTHDYGFGLEVFANERDETTEVGHWGNGGGHIAFLWSYPPYDIAVVALQNSNGRLAPLLDEIESILLGVTCDE